MKENQNFRYLFIPISFIGLLCCLDRSDYNVILGIFGYFLWAEVQFPQKHRILWLCIISLLGDFLWILCISIGVWSQHPDSNSMRALTQIFSLLNMIYKISIIIYAINWIEPCGDLLNCSSFYRKVLYVS